MKVRALLCGTKHHSILVITSQHNSSNLRMNLCCDCESVPEPYICTSLVILDHYHDNYDPWNWNTMETESCEVG